MSDESSDSDVDTAIDDESDEEQELGSVFGIRSIPSLLFIPKDGQPKMAVGALPKNALKEAIEKELFVKAA